MATATATLEPKATRASGLQPGTPIRFTTDWNGYLTVLMLVGDRRLRTFYTDGEMEILMPSHRHEVWVALLGQFVELLTLLLGIPRKSGGMTTFRREDIERGLEPDRCYYIANEPLVRTKFELDLSVDPPPDLAIEVEVTYSIEKRMRVYAGLGVPEVWRFDGQTLIVNHLVANGEYIVADESKVFPFLPVQELTRFVNMYEQLGETAVASAFRDWVIQQAAAGWPTRSEA
ncbi:MAG TPA: Uma2 family endonuclease [Gemmataceae bacterium]|jgi:Uma2 family endonuclease|nr:Uma2 family endonuclease [Gemmataceae bacterium]